MFQVGQKCVSNLGKTATITAICGGRVYYVDSYGCCFYKPDQVFEQMYTVAQ